MKFRKEEVMKVNLKFQEQFEPAGLDSREAKKQLAAAILRHAERAQRVEEPSFFELLSARFRRTRRKG